MLPILITQFETFKFSSFYIHSYLLDLDDYSQHNMIPKQLSIIQCPRINSTQTQKRSKQSQTKTPLPPPQTTPLFPTIPQPNPSILPPSEEITPFSKAIQYRTLNPMKKGTGRLTLKDSGVSLSNVGEQTHRHDNNELMTPQPNEQYFQQEEMRNIRERVVMKRVIKKMQAIIPLHSPPVKVAEEWENNMDCESSRSETNSHSLDEQITALYPSVRLLSILQGLSILLFLWLVSVTIVFRLDSFAPAYLTIISIEVLNIIIKISIVSNNQELLNFALLSRTKEIFLPLLILSGCGLMLVRPLFTQGLVIVVDILAGMFFCVLARNVSQYFEAIKGYAEQKKVIKELRIIELFCLLLMIAHVFGLILFSSAQFTPEGESNWLQKAQLQHKPWGICYIYSVYWAITTIVTVGYGDLTPSNYRQVLVVMLIQICGTSFFGYMINVIGITVDNINRKNEEYDNYQETIAKLKDHYQLTSQLCQTMKNDIKAKYNESKATPLNKNEEIDFLEYVDSTVKKNFILETNIRIIKKSIFFLTYFTVEFQNEIALKLVRVIYKKDQKIEATDSHSKQHSLIIINHGKVNVFIERKQNNLSRQKLVKAIEPIEGKHTLNVFGYSGLILDRHLTLFAVAEQMTSGYQLKRDDVLECIEKSMQDYESFHEMRERMLLFPLKQAIQAPTLRGPEYHYVPNIFILGCRNSRRFNQTRSKVERRHNRISLLLLDKIKAEATKKKFTVFLDDNAENMPQDSQVRAKEVNEFQSLLSIQSEGHEHVSLAETNQLKPSDDFLRLDQVKIFEHFMKLHNVNTVASNYEKSCKSKTYAKRIMPERLAQQNL